ncbi:hypothetical protein E4U41_007276 [Claviceps citrina]|nr:hypothetical protein E4U41_007276 [Claviceps citrina]
MHTISVLAPPADLSHLARVLDEVLVHRNLMTAAPGRYRRLADLPLASGQAMWVYMGAMDWDRIDAERTTDYLETNIAGLLLARGLPEMYGYFVQFVYMPRRPGRRQEVVLYV